MTAPAVRHCGYLPEDIRPAGKRHMREKTPEPDENRGFPVRGFRRVRSENASGILVTREAAGAEAPFCRISCRSGRAAYPTEDTRRPEAGKDMSTAVTEFLTSLQICVILLICGNIPPGG